jgi:hypothetical protein
MREKENGGGWGRDISYKLIFSNLDLLLCHLYFPSKVRLRPNLKRRSCAPGTRQT